MFEIANDNTVLINMNLVAKIDVERDVSGAYNVCAYLPDELNSSLPFRYILRSFTSEEEAKDYLFYLYSKYK